MVQRLAHPVQALELESVGVVARHRQDRRAGLRVVGGELGIDPVAHPHQHPRAGQKADIRARLAGEDREGLDTQLLRELDLGVPVGALDEAHHDPPVEPLGQRVEMLDHRDRAPAIGLHHHAEAVPAGERLVLEQRLDHVERQIEPVLLLGVDVEADIGLRRLTGEAACPRQQHLHHRRAMGVLVARMQRRELDRDAGGGAHIALCLRRDGADRLRIGRVIAQGVRLGPRGLPQHVVGIGVALALLRAGILHPVRDGLAQDELLAEQTHRLPHRGAHDGLADTPDQPAQRGRGPSGIVVQNPAREHQRPGRGIDQRGGGVPEMRAPVRGLDLVVDQVVDGLGIGHAQQRLGEAHQPHPLLGREPVFREESLHHRGRGLAAHALDQPGAVGRDRLALRARQVEAGQAVGHHFRLGRGVARTNGGAGLGHLGGGHVHRGVSGSSLSPERGSARPGWQPLCRDQSPRARSGARICLSSCIGPQSATRATGLPSIAALAFSNCITPSIRRSRKAQVFSNPGLSSPSQ